MKTNTMNNKKQRCNGHAETPRERILAALRLNHGRLLLWELEKLAGVKRPDVEDLLMLVPRPIAIEYLNGRKKPSTYVLLKDYGPSRVATQEEAAKALNEMTPQEYREFLIRIDPSFKSRLARRGYGKRGITPEEYLS